MDDCSLKAHWDSSSDANSVTISPSYKTVSNMKTSLKGPYQGFYISFLYHFYSLFVCNKPSEDWIQNLNSYQPFLCTLACSVCLFNGSYSMCVCTTEREEEEKQGLILNLSNQVPSLKAFPMKILDDQRMHHWFHEWQQILHNQTHSQTALPFLSTNLAVSPQKYFPY